MAFLARAASVVLVLAVVIFCCSLWRASTTANAVGLSVPVNAFAASLSSLSYDQLAQRILQEQQNIRINQALLDSLEAPAPIYATERSALPVNKLAIATYHAHFKAYSAALATARIHLAELYKAREQRFAETQAQEMK